MTARGKKTAAYRIITDAGGNRYRFFCDLSGAAMCTTHPVMAETQEEELTLAWESEGRKHFNLCHNCGKWVCEAMYNADVSHCVECTPWESLPRFCSECGEKVPAENQFCHKCGAKLQYREVTT